MPKRKLLGDESIKTGSTFSLTLHSHRVPGALEVHMQQEEVENLKI